MDKLNVYNIIVRELSKKYGFDYKESLEYLKNYEKEKEKENENENIEETRQKENKSIYKKIDYSDLNDIKKDLEKNGVAVVKLFNRDECEEIIKDIIKDLENLAIESRLYDDDFTLYDKDNWRKFILNDLAASHGQLFKHYVGCCPTLWKVRFDRRIQELYAKIYNCDKEELGVSYDGFSLSVNPNYFEYKNGGDKGKKWMHVDQTFYDSNMKCIQGLLNCKDIHEGVATFSCYTKSHLYHNEFFHTFNQRKHSKRNWDLLNEKELEWYKEKGCEEIRVLLNAGDFILWDSRTVHMGAQPTVNRKISNANFEIERCVFYVCYQKKPQELTEKEFNKIKKKREKAEKEGILTCHWPWNELKLNGKHPRTYGDEMKEKRNKIIGDASEKLMKKISIIKQ